MVLWCHSGAIDFYAAFLIVTHFDERIAGVLKIVSENVLRSHSATYYLFCYRSRFTSTTN